MQRVGSTRRKKASEIPFGIRAIESGIEVDGVWISRSNTPVPSAPPSPAPASPLSSPSIVPRPHPHLKDSPDRSSSASNISRLDIPQPVHGYPGVNLRHSGPSSSSLNTPSERLKPASDLPDLTRVQPTRPTYQPRHSSQLRYSNSHDYDDDDVAPATGLESDGFSSDRKTSDGALAFSCSCSWALGRVALFADMRPASDDQTEQRVLESSPASAISEEHPLSFQREEFDSASEFSFRMASSDRINETTTILPLEPSFQSLGYPTPEPEQAPPAVPRIKLNGVDNELSATRHLTEHNWYFTKPPTPLHENENPFTTPRKNPIETQQTRRSMGLNNSEPSYSQYRNSDKDERLQKDMDTQLTPAVERHRPKSESQVIRKINSGFEILRPGTLNRPQVDDDTHSKGEINAEKPTSRKLQRRSRDVGHSRGSKFVEET